MNIPSFVRLFSLPVLAATLAACSDSGSSSGGSATTSFSGKVADGYLAGARVCLDLNDNQGCDDGEPFTLSGNGGTFTIDDATEAQLASAAIVVEIIVGETEDEDNPGVAIQKTYTLTAPAGYGFVSPLTTMVHNEAKEKGLTAAEAKAAVQVKLGTDLDLEDDYVAGKGDGGNNAEEFGRLHKVAQVTRAVMQENIETVNQVLTNTEADFEDILSLIVSKVLSALEEINTAVNNAGSNFDPDTIAGSGQLPNAGINPATVKDDLEEREAAREASTVSIADVLRGGDSLTFFDSDSYEGEGSSYFYGEVALQQGSTTAVTVTHHMYNAQSDTWDTRPAFGDYQECIRSGGSWQCFAEGNETISISGSSVLVRPGGIASAQETITGASINLSGKRIKTYAGESDFEDVLDPTASFSDGATAFRLTFTRASDVYSVWKDNVESTAQCWEGEGSTSGAWSPTDVWCNNVFLRTGDGNNNTDGNAATTLQSLVSSAAASSPDDPADIKGTDIYTEDGNWMVEFVSGGVANYYHYSYDDQRMEGPVRGSWRQTTVDGAVMMIFTLPEIVVAKGDLDDDERIRFFTVTDGYVRQGDVRPAGPGNDDEWVFNGVARADILAAFDPDLSTDLPVCSSGDTEDGSFSDFESAASACSVVAFTSADISGRALHADFGVFEFNENGTGSYLGEVDDDDYVYLNFSWQIDSSGYLIINTSATVDGGTQFMRMHLAKIEANARQISVISLGLDAASEAALDTATGDVMGEVFNLR